MAWKSVKVADKPTLDLVKSNIGNTDDRGGTTESGTVMAKENAILGNMNTITSQVVSMRTEMKELLDGEPSAFGTASLGTVTYSENFGWPAKDYFNRYILQFQDFTLPEGVTMTPPEKCDGLYIYCKGTCTINGTINMRGKRLTLDGDAGISNFIQVGEKQYALACGGDTVKGGDGGYSGDRSNKGKSYAQGGKAGNPTAGNINGGGSNNYGFAGVPFANGYLYERYNNSNGWYVTDEDGNRRWWGTTPGATSDSWPIPIPPASAQTGGVSAYREASGAVIILANKLVINGIVDCSAIEGVACINKVTDGVIHTFYLSNTGATACEEKAQCGKGTDGSQAPTGGGCITILANSFTNNGRLLTNGQSLIAESTAVGADVNASDSEDGETATIYVTGGKAGGGGTFISQAGEIKVHILSA